MITLVKKSQHSLYKQVGNQPQDMCEPLPTRQNPYQSSKIKAISLLTGVGAMYHKLPHQGTARGNTERAKHLLHNLC